MTKDTKLSQLVINKLTSIQYDLLEEKDPNQLYIVTDGKPSGFDLFDHKWSDHILNDASWLRADTFNWQSGELYKSAYKHLVDDLKPEILYAWSNETTTIYTKTETPAKGAYTYNSSGDMRGGAYGKIRFTVTSFDGNILTTRDNLTLTRNASADVALTQNTQLEPQTETIGSNTITYYLATDGHKIVLADQESAVQGIYEETGSAWYYILDIENKRFKLPRELPITDKVKGNGMTLGLTDGTNNVGVGTGYAPAGYSVLSVQKALYGKSVGISANVDTGLGSKTYGITTDPTMSGIISHRANGHGKQYFYFYMGEYTESALEQIAGVTMEVLNGKMDKSDMQVVSELPAAPVEGVYYFVKE
jgi:hypothetical protein